MTEPVIGYAALQVIPTLQGVQGNIEGQLTAPLVSAGREAGQATGRAIVQGVEAAQAAVERAAEALKTAREKEADAAGKVRVAEEKLRELRAKGTASASQLARAEEALLTAQRNEERAARGTQRAITALARAHEDLANATDEAEVSQGRFTGALNRMMGQLGPAAKQMAALGVAALGVGTAVDTAMAAMDKEVATDKLAAQLGAGPAMAEEFGGIAGRLYADAYGENLGEVTEALRQVWQQGLVEEDASSAEIEAVTGTVLDLAKAFDQDVMGAAGAVGTMLKTGLAPDAEAAMDILTRGFQQGADKGGDLLDTFIEYPALFQALGLSAAETTGILSQGLAAGAFNADKVADALKEFQIRATDGSESSAAAYEALGLSAEEMTAQIAAGGAGAREGLDLVLDRLRAMEDPVARNAAAVGIFGTQAEDLAGALFALDPSEAVAGLGDVEGAAAKMSTTLNDNAATALEKLKRGIQEGLVNELTSAAGWIDRNREVAAGLAIGVGVLGGVLVTAKVAATGYAIAQGVMAAATGAGTAAIAANSLATGAYAVTTGVVRGATAAWAATQWLLNAAMTANPIGIVVVAIAALAAGLVLAYQKSETFRGIVQGAFGVVQDVLGGVAGFVTDTVIPAVLNFWHGAVEPAFAAIGAVISYWWDNVGSPIFNNAQLAISLVGDAITWWWQSVVTPAFDAVGAVIGFWWSNIVEPAFNLAKTGVGVLGDSFTWFNESVVSPAMSAVGSAVSTAYDNVISPTFELMKTGIGWVGDAFSATGTLIGKVFDGVVGVIRIPVHALGELLAGVPTSIGPVEIPGAGVARDLGERLKKFRQGGTIGAALAGRTADGLLWGPGTGTSDSILGIDGRGVPTAFVSAGEGVVTEAAMDAGGDALVAALNAGWVPPLELLRAMLPGYAGGTVQVAEGDINDQQRAMWQALTSAWPDAVLTSATRYADVGSGFDHHMGGKAIDIAGPDMVGMASWIAKHYPDSLELIHANGFGHNIKNGKDVGDGMAFYGADTMAGHADHLHWATATAPAMPAIEPGSGGGGLSGGGSSGGGGGTSGGASSSGGSGGSGGGTTSRPTGDATPVWIVGSDIGGIGASSSATAGPGTDTTGASTSGTDTGGADTGGGSNTTPKSHPLQGAPLTGEFFNGDAPWYQQDDPWSYLQTKAADQWTTTQDETKSYFESNWKEMVNSALSVVGIGATGGAQAAPTFNISGTDPMGAAAAVDRVLRRRTMALQRGGGISR